MLECAVEDFATETRCWTFSIPSFPIVNLLPRLSFMTLLGMFEVVARRNLYLYLPHERARSEKEAGKWNLIQIIDAVGVG